ncbi:MAG: hypothetical protein ABW123_13460 [Cystobacter sp.]
MGLRELKEEAMYLYAKGRFAECAQTYERVLDLDPRDPALYMRQAEAYRRAHCRREAVNAYRMAAELLFDQGSEARSRAALKVALELDPRNTELVRALERRLPPGREDARPTTLATPGELFEYPEHLEQRPDWHENVLAPNVLAPEEPPLAPQPEVRRLSDNMLAIRAGPGMPWFVVSSRASLLTYQVAELEHVTDQDFSLEVTFQPDA